MRRLPTLRMFDKPRITRYLLRGVIGAGMVSLFIVLDSDAVIAAYVVERIPFLSVDMLRGALFWGGIGLWIAPVRAPVLIYWLTLPLLTYAIGGIGGALDGRFQEWTGIFYFLFIILFIILYWREDS